MNRTIHIIGTSHDFQHFYDGFSESSHANFQTMLRRTISKYSISLISEESNEEALAENNISDSAPRLIAKDIGLKHLFTEADYRFRSKNGIAQENDIRISGFHNNLSNIEIENNVRKSFRARELYWFEQILKLNCWPALHICGANHSREFCNLVNRNNVVGHLLHEDWLG